MAEGSENAGSFRGRVGQAGEIGKVAAVEMLSWVAVR